MALTPHTLVLGDIANADGTVDFILSVDPPDDGSAWMSMAPTTRSSWVESSGMTATNKRRRVW